MTFEDRKIEADVYQLKVSRSSGKVLYFYDAENPLLPLRVERFEPDENPSIMTLRKVDWGF